jgi:PBP1b-binding outer membrane lipoprotein LpoB
LKKIYSLVIILHFALVGCSGIQTEGYVLVVEENRILVAEKITEEEYESIKDKSISEIDEERISLIYFSYGDKEKINVGDKVKVWFDGNMATSYPAQAGATKIEIKE